jgi:hypothetical protein
MKVGGNEKLLARTVWQRMSGAGHKGQNRQEGKWVPLKLDQFPLLLMVSLSDHVETVPG